MPTPRFSTLLLVGGGESQAMVEAMGGLNSKYYNQFKNLAGQAFNILRRHANLILALLKLMAQVRTWWLVV
jgi:hypothetical protein